MDGGAALAGSGWSTAGNGESWAVAAMITVISRMGFTKQHGAVPWMGCGIRSLLTDQRHHAALQRRWIVAAGNSRYNCVIINCNNKAALLAGPAGRQFSGGIDGQLPNCQCRGKQHGGSAGDAPPDHQRPVSGRD